MIIFACRYMKVSAKMELRQLRYFTKVAETLNFSEAARQLFVAQSTLSQQIKLLEDELGTSLLVRNSHNVGLTEAGAELLPYARRALTYCELCVERLNDLANLSAGELNIGVTYSFSSMLTETVVDFMKRYPKVRLNIIYKPMNDLMEMLTHRDVDFVLAFRPNLTVAGVESHILFQNRLAVVVDINHPLAGKEKVSLDELAAYNLALPARGLQARNAFDAVTADRSQLRIMIEMNEVNILLKIVRNTSLVTVLAEDSIYGERDLKAIPLDIPDNEMMGCVHILKDTYHKKSMKKFIGMLTESIPVKARQQSWI